MLHKLRKIYYDNKTQIWRVILIIASILIIIQLANYFIRRRSENLVTNTTNNSNINSTILNTTENTDIFVSSNTSSVTGTQIDNTTLASETNIINNFILACNNSNIEEAYSYISSDCKSELYETIDIFKSLYYDTIFSRTKKNVSVENWLQHTYKIDISEDIMATGNANNLKTQDYITVVKDNGEWKLNINNFVGKEEINEEQEIDGLKFIIISKKTYMDYEEYELQVENRTGTRVLLDSQQNTKSIYIEDKNGTEYYSYSHELLSSLLEINNGFLSHVTIKFSKQYSIERESRTIVFSDIIIYDTSGEITKKQVELYI